VTELGAGLTIGELAVRTAVPAATLRSWEARYGFPRPRRLEGGHRRYDLSDVALVREVIRQRDAGMSLPAAISQAASRGTETGSSSIFADLRRRQPGLAPQVLRKRTLLALTWAMEDEYCARAEHALLFAAFERQRYYRRSQARWRELARTAQTAVAFADFAGPSGPGVTPLEVPVPAGAPLRREWALVCDSRDYPACLAGWEFPGQDDTPDGDRRFEVIWSLSPRVVRDAAMICAQLAELFSPGLALLDQLPAEPSPPASADLERATGLLTRMISNLEAASARAARRP
jgi:DICT domain-containing protein